MTRLKSGMALLVCGALALAACGGDDDDVAKAAANAAKSGGNPVPSSVPSVGGGDGSGKVPDDACAALPKDKVDALVPGARIEGPLKQGAGGSWQSHCSWANDTVTLNLDYIAGVPHDQLLMSMNTEMQDNHGDKVQVAGDDAGVWSPIPGKLQVSVVHDDVFATVDILVVQGEAKQFRSQMLALAEAAVGAL